MRSKHFQLLWSQLSGAQFQSWNFSRNDGAIWLPRQSSLISRRLFLLVSTTSESGTGRWTILMHTLFVLVCTHFLL